MDATQRAAGLGSGTGRSERPAVPAVVTRFLRAAQRIFATAEEAIEVLDSRFNVLAVNDAHARCTGLDRRECVGRRSVVLRTIQDRRRLRRIVVREMERSGIWRGEIAIPHTVEGPFPVRMLLKELRHGTGDGCLYLAVFAGIATQALARQANKERAQ